MAESDTAEDIIAGSKGGLVDSEGAETIPEDNHDQEMKDRAEEKNREEKKESEEKNVKEESAVAKVREEAEKEENKTDDVDMAEAEDVKALKDGETEEKVELEENTSEEGGEEEERSKPKEEEGRNKEQGTEDLEKEDESKEVETTKKKRSRGRKTGGEGDAKHDKERKTKAKEPPRAPAASRIERPVRERKTVERLVEVIEKGPSKGFIIEKGHGTPLKDIPNVAYKLARKKPADLKLLHQTLFGRRAKVTNLKNHVLQFSGFPWPSNDEKQKTKVKEKLDKHVKDALLEICELFDIPVSKAATRKEDLVVKLLDFMIAPHATTDVILAEKEQSSKSKKRKRAARGTTSKSAGGTSVRRSTKNKGEHPPQIKENIRHETEEDSEDNENSAPDEDESHKHFDSDRSESESEAAAEGDRDDGKNSTIDKQGMKKSLKQCDLSEKKKLKAEASPKKAPKITTESPSILPSPSKHKVEETNDAGEKVFTRKRRSVDSPKKKTATKPEKEKSTGKRVAADKAKSDRARHSGPSKDQLRKAICEILKEVDFNTATFTDILKQLATRYNTDLTPRKSAIKLIIQEELTKLADEAEDDEDGEEDGNTEGGKSKSAGTELEA